MVASLHFRVCSFSPSIDIIKSDQSALGIVLRGQRPGSKTQETYLSWREKTYFLESPRAQRLESKASMRGRKCP